MSRANSTCRVCGVILDSDNWSPSRRKGNHRICKSCNREYLREWHKAHPTKRSEYNRQRYKNHPEKIKECNKRWYENNREKVRSQYIRHRHEIGYHLYHENKECASYLGIHVAERVLSHVFINVENMPMHNPGYDFICNHGKKMDVKSSCLLKEKHWNFHIGRNTTADFFLCLAFDNRDDLNPLHIWLLPGNAVNHLMGASISISTVHKWDKYKLDISKVSACCEAIR